MFLLFKSLSISNALPLAYQTHCPLLDEPLDFSNSSNEDDGNNNIDNQLKHYDTEVTWKLYETQNYKKGLKGKSYFYMDRCCFGNCSNWSRR